jgi:glycolate oxidase FAD binding subunit
MAVAVLPGTRADAVLGVQPSRLFRPASLDEAEDALRQTALEHLRVAFVGGGTELELGAPPSGLDAVVSTQGLGRVLEYAPLDQIVTAEAGVTLAALQTLLKGKRQMLALDPPWPDRATVGGVVATNAFGPRRTRYGSIRDLIIGVTLVRADGTRAKGGGKVVKNVAGFDLPKLMVGSLGSLGLIGTVTFRLHPFPESASTVVFPRATAAAVGRLVLEMRQAQLEPAAVAALWSESGFDLGCRFEGFDAGVRKQREHLSALGRHLDIPNEVLDGTAADGFWSRQASVREAPATVRIKLGCLPTEVARVAAEVWTAVRAALQAPRGVFYPTLGLAFVAGNMKDAGALSAAIARARASLVPKGGHLVLHAAPAELRARTDVWGPPPSGAVLFQRMKDALDPEHRLAPGRTVGGR